MPALFEAYITNLGKYNEGELVGETLKFPTTKEEVQGLLKRIGVDGVRYEEFFITSFDGDVLGLYDYRSTARVMDRHLQERLDAAAAQGYTQAVEKLIARAEALRPAPIKEQMAKAAKEAGKENAARPTPAKGKEARDDR